MARENIRIIEIRFVITNIELVSDIKIRHLKNVAVFFRILFHVSFHVSLRLIRILRKPLGRVWVTWIVPMRIAEEPKIISLENNGSEYVCCDQSCELNEFLIRGHECYLSL